MPVLFPTIRPSNRTVSLGNYPVKRQLSPAGTGVSRRYGTAPIDLKQSLEFANITDASTAEIVEAYNQASGFYYTLSFPTIFWSDLESPLLEHLRDFYTWYFISAPIIRLSSIPGFKNVSVELEGTSIRTTYDTVNTTYGPFGINGPQWGAPGPDSGSWDLQFTQTRTSKATVGLDANGNIVLNSNGLPAYPEVITVIGTESITLQNMIGWWHFAEGYTKYEFGSTESPILPYGSVGINAVKNLTQPYIIYSSNSQAVRGVTQTLIGPWRTVYFYTTIANFMIRPYTISNSEVFQMATPPVPFILP